MGSQLKFDAWEEIPEEIRDKLETDFDVIRDYEKEMVYIGSSLGGTDEYLEFSHSSMNELHDVMLEVNVALLAIDLNGKDIRVEAEGLFTGQRQS